MTTQDPVAEKLDAELRETESRLEVLEAEAEARKARDEMAEISGLNATKDRVQRKLTELKQETREGADTVRREIEALLRDLKTGIKHVGERFAAWDAARERRFSALLDEAEARIKAWNAQEEQREAERGVHWHDVLATLRERTALARARLAEWQHARHDRKAQEALEEAAEHFDEAFEAARSRYQK